MQSIAKLLLLHVLAISLTIISQLTLKALTYSGSGDVSQRLLHKGVGRHS